MAISLRTMTPDDIELGMRLKQQAGWNQTVHDWQRFLTLEPEGCFVAAWDGRDVATTTTCVFGSVGWIAMVLVHESYRHRGIATRLVQRALEHLTRRSVRTVRLDATPDGRPVYARLGFVADYELARFHGTGKPLRREPSRPFLKGFRDISRPEAIVDLDGRATGVPRTGFLGRLLREFPQQAVAIQQESSLQGFTFFRPGSEAFQLGPTVALNSQAGRALGDWALEQIQESAVYVDIPLANTHAVEWAQSRGLIEQRRFWRMSQGQSVDDDPTILWTSSGPEKG